MGSSQSYYAEDLKQFFQTVKEGDRKSIYDPELKLWDFIIYYLEWLNFSVNGEVDSLQSLYQEYRQKVRDDRGSGTWTYEWSLIRDIDRIKERIGGNGAEFVHRRVLEAVKDSFLSGKMPPRFNAASTSSREKEVFDISKMTKFFEAFKKNNTPDDVLERCIPDEKQIIDVILYYLEWLESPNQDELLLHAAYENFRKLRWVSLGRTYESILHSYLEELKDKVEAAGGDISHMELVNIIGEFLKRGELPPAAHALHNRIRPPPYDTTLESFRTLSTREMAKSVARSMKDIGFKCFETYYTPSLLASSVDRQLSGVRFEMEALRKREKELLEEQAKIRILLEKVRREEGHKTKG